MAETWSQPELPFRDLLGGSGSSLLVSHPSYHPGEGLGKGVNPVLKMGMRVGMKADSKNESSVALTWGQIE